MSSLVEGNSAFALDLYGKLKSGSGNLFFSPSSISTALAMTYAGAGGETAQQMAQVMHFPGPQEEVATAFSALLKSLKPQDASQGYQLSMANRLWGQQGFHILPGFQGITRDAYQAELALVDFVHQTEQARGIINQWVEAQTQEKIRDLLPQGSLTTETRLVLTNAIYFKGDWTHPFREEATVDEDFHVTSDKTTRVPMMRQKQDFRYAELDGLKVLDLSYGPQKTLSAIMILPDQVDGLPALEQSLRLEDLNRWQKSVRPRKVEVFLPRFTLSSQFSMSQTLQDMGMALAFDRRKANFSGISTEDELYITDVVHKAFVDLNEKGTEAAAATGVIMATRAAILPTQPAVFRADHPFLFLIVDNRNRNILFMGRVVNPRG